MRVGLSSQSQQTRVNSGVLQGESRGRCLHLSAKHHPPFPLLRWRKGHLFSSAFDAELEPAGT